MTRPGEDMGIFLGTGADDASVIERLVRVEVELRREIARSRRLIEELLITSAERDAVDALVCTVDERGVIHTANRRWIDRTVAAVGQPFWTATTSEDRTEVRARWVDAVATGSALAIDARLRGRAGEPRWFAIRVSRVDRAPAGRRWVAIATDVDDYRREIARLAEVDRARTEFIARLGHELRNPLTPIQVALDQLGLLGVEGVARPCATIARQVARVMRLVDDVVDTARVQHGKVSVDRQRMPLRVAIDAAVEACAPAIAQRGHALTVDVADDLALIGDPDRLAQVFSNLIGNAAKYTPDGGHIAIRAARIGDALVIDVADDGIGIPVEQQATVFDAFVQGRDRAQPGGLGLGLSIARDLVALHGGTLTVRSAGIGRGSTFTVRLPASDQGQPSFPSMATGAPRATGA